LGVAACSSTSDTSAQRNDAGDAARGGGEGGRGGSSAGGSSAGGSSAGGSSAGGSSAGGSSAGGSSAGGSSAGGRGGTDGGSADSGSNADGGTERSDGSVLDAQPVAPDCASYCDEVQANCTGPDSQYSDTAHCMATCASFTVGSSTATDTTGDTLGCRMHYAGAPSASTPATDCPLAGPAGDRINLPVGTVAAFCSGSNVCESFCRLELEACGSQDAPLPGNPKDAANNPLFQYRNMTNCLSTCAAFDQTHAYSTSATGDSLACRFYQATLAAVAVTPDGATHCAQTGAAPSGACAGAATP
jgi:hypothetical protein